jgi:GntR family transcriptional regulator
MFFSIDPNNGVAIYDQIVRQVKFAIAEKILQPGQLLPSVRVLSQQLTINPNTINRAFQQLQSEGIVESLRGVGLVVQQSAPQQCSEARKKLLADRLRAALSEALHAGLKASDIERMVQELLGELAGQVPTVSSQPLEALQ